MLIRLGNGAVTANFDSIVAESPFDSIADETPREAGADDAVPDWV